MPPEASHPPQPTLRLVAAGMRPQQHSLSIPDLHSLRPSPFCVCVRTAFLLLMFVRKQSVPLLSPRFTLARETAIRASVPRFPRGEAASTVPSSLHHGQRLAAVDSAREARRKAVAR